MNSPQVPVLLNGLRVLVVDDEYLVAMHIETNLEDLGCIVVGPVATVEAALAAVKAGGIDGAMLDANLNGKTSSPIATELRARNIPFVVVTGYGNLDLISEALNAAPRLSKPFSAAQFEAAIVSAFVDHKLHPQPN